MKSVDCKDCDYELMKGIHIGYLYSDGSVHTHPQIITLEINPEILKLIDKALVLADKPETKDIFEILKEIHQRLQ